LTVYVNKFLRHTRIGTDHSDISILNEVYTALTGLFTASKLTINMKKLIVEPLVAYIEDPDESVRLKFTVREGGEVELGRCGVDTKKTLWRR
jgi:hypothetical protein